MQDPLVSIVLRSFNEGWALRETLPALKAQEYRNWELIVIDSGSTDGSVELIEQADPAHFLRIEPQEYIPGRVLNTGMDLARSNYVVFVNADATPQGENWLRPLVAGLYDQHTAAVFGRQIPRPDCRAVFACDYDRCFGPERESVKWDHFFSMANSGLRKDIWAKRKFSETLRYSEDDEYTRWCKAQGYGIRYCADSVVMHSHNYTPAQAYKRGFGEGQALAYVWPGEASEMNAMRTLLLGWANDLSKDVRFCKRHQRWSELPYAARIRWQLRRGRLAGFQDGWNSIENTMISTVEKEPRFTMDGSEALESALSQICQTALRAISKAVPAEKLEGLLLAGGYGRGEGGVLQTGGGDAPYNDLDFYVFLNGNRWLNQRAFGPALHELAEGLSHHAEVEIELKLDSLARWRRLPVTMFSYDVLLGHKWILGDESLFAGCEHHREAECISACEAARLMLNRCSGLLFAAEHRAREHFGEEEADFVARNLAKAQLGMGDAVLTMFGQYHWSCVERHERLQRLRHDVPWLKELQHHHAAGVEFKLHPKCGTANGDDVTTLARKVWLWLEGQRLGRSFDSIPDYARSSINKCPETKAWRNCMIHCRTFGCTPSVRYPRERLFHALPLLLWERARLAEQLPFLQRTLNTKASDFRSLVQAYQRLWRNFN